MQFVMGRQRVITSTILITANVLNMWSDTSTLFSTCKSLFNSIKFYSYFINLEIQAQED